MGYEIEQCGQKAFSALEMASKEALGAPVAKWLPGPAPQGSSKPCQGQACHRHDAQSQRARRGPAAPSPAWTHGRMSAWAHGRVGIWAMGATQIASALCLLRGSETMLGTSAWVHGCMSATATHKQHVHCAESKTTTVAFEK